MTLALRSAFTNTLPPLVVRRGGWQAIGSEERDWRGPGHAPREMARDSGGSNARSHGKLSAGPAGGSIGFLKKGGRRNWVLGR